MEILEILNRLEENEVYLSLDGDNLELSFMQDELPDEIITLLKSNKAALVSYLQDAQEQDRMAQLIPVEAQDSYPLSAAQKRMWILSQFEEVSPGYNLPAFFQLKGTYDLKALEQAILALVERHEILRTVFRTDEQETVRQHVIPMSQFPFAIGRHDFSTAPDPEQAAQEWIFADYYKPFDLENGPLLRVNLIQLAKDQYLCYYNLHHIVGDGWSLNVLSRDVLAIYSKLTGQTDQSLPPLRIQYKDYAAWQLQQFAGKAFERHKQYWLEKLSGEIPALDLPSNLVRPDLRSNNGRLISGFLDTGLTTDIRSFLRKKGGTLFPFLLASFKVLLYKYTRQSDIAVGTPVAGREHPELENQIGVYINTIVLRNKVQADLSFDQFYDVIKGDLLEAYAHQAYPFDLLVEALKLEKDSSRNPLFDIMLAMRNTETSDNDLNLEELDLTAAAYDREVKAKLDLEIGFKENDRHIGIELMYNTDIYEYTQMQRMLQHFQQLLRHLLDDSSRRLADLSYLTVGELQTLNDFNATDRAYDSRGTILRELMKQVSANAGAAAVRDASGQSLSFGELDARSNQLSHYLIEAQGVVPGDLVGLRQDRSCGLLVSILGILKAGAAYVPVDMDYPADRQAFIAEDSGYKLCLDGAALAAFEHVRARYSTAPCGVVVEGPMPAYAIYTSGSTGRPKGVLNRHESLYNRLLWMSEGLSIGPEAILLQKTPYTFDVSVWELLLPCLSGSCLVFARPEGHKDPLYLHELIEEAQVSVIHFVPSMLGMFLEVLDAEKCRSLRHIVCSGEALPGQMVERIQGELPWVRLHNLYGPTEAAIDVSWAELTSVDVATQGVSIGKPVANTRLYVVDGDLSLQGLGIAGELVIEGIQVASGYLNRPELTAEKFVASPFRAGERLYRTGDLCKWLPSGELAYLGRLDHQVKIRGNRIELGEIEHQLEASGQVEQAAVVVQSLSSGDKSLLAYVKLKPEGKLEAIYAQLEKNLPDYMRPSRLIELGAFPQTSSGKVDRKALHEQAALEETGKGGNEAPANELEAALQDLWQSVLEHGDFGVTDNFFRVGGDSILSIRLVSRLNKTYHSALKLGEVYQYNTIRSQAAWLSAQPQGSDKRTEGLAELKAMYEKLDYDDSRIEGLYPMSDIQRGMVYASLNNPEAGMYHDQFVYTIPRPTDEAVLLSALKAVVARHETLRTSFDLDHYAEPLQVLHRQIEVEDQVGFEDLRGYPPSEQRRQIEDFLRAQRGRIFRYEAAPLWRIDLFGLDEQHSVYVLQFHHAILDGWSVALFNTELFNTYRAMLERRYVKAPALACSVRDVVLAERLDKEEGALRSYWKAQLQGYRKLELFEGTESIYQNYHRDLGAGLTQRLRSYTQGGAVHHRSILLGAFVYVLRALSGEEDLLIGQVSNNRLVAEDGERVLGCFLNTLPLRLKPFEQGQSWRSYMAAVEADLETLRRHDRLTIYELSKLAGREAQGENPFFDVIYNYVDFNNSYKALELGAATGEQTQAGIPSFEQTNTFLDINVRDHGGGTIELQLLQTRPLKAHLDVALLLDYVVKVLEAFLEQPEAVAQASKILNAADRNRRYWTEQLRGSLPVLNLPRQVGGQGNVLHKTLHLELVQPITAANKPVHLLSAWAVLLHRYTGQEDLLLGVQEGGESTVLVRPQLQGSKTFEEHYEQIGALLERGRLHRAGALEALQGQWKRSSAEVQVYLEGGLPAVSGADLELSLEEGGTGKWQLALRYDAGVYEAATMEGLLGHYATLLNNLEAQPSMPISTIRYLSAAEQQQLIEDLNATAVPYDKTQSLVDLFEGQVARTPHLPALLFQTEVYSYAQLNAQANQFAHYLQEHFRVQQGDFVGIKLPRAAELVIAILGTLKTGASYIPLDVNYPDERINYIERDSACRCMVDQRVFEAFARQQEPYSKENPGLVIDAAAVAYVIYTSGTTGDPKGVLI
ncbi:MAG: amino acid adenylation domain-containing protein [Phaeodactylibacter sp.]|nr:amino acid adenylation domain-containing protein [Phaeodactylibacter sp.]